MNDCMAYKQVTAPSQQNPTSAPTDIDVVYDACRMEVLLVSTLAI